MNRRQVVAGMAAMGLQAGVRAASQPEPLLLAAWADQASQHIGLLRMGADGAAVVAEQQVPTRAHGVLAEPGGWVLAVARRPGDWLLRWCPHSGEARWCWQDDDLRFNGHVDHLRAQKWVLTTETDRETGEGFVGVRQHATLARVAQWPSFGKDPHQLLVLPAAVGPWRKNTVLVANGGIAHLAETGRSKRQGVPMDPSLVALDPWTGRLLGQWRLDDPFLSIRHLAWHAADRCVGIALQAEHPDAEVRHSAPVLAVWHGAGLQIAEASRELGGYGGDIVALDGSGFAVSCTKADGLALFSAGGDRMIRLALPGAGALAQHGGRWWSAGRNAVLTGRHGGLSAPVSGWAQRCHDGPCQIDNHWRCWTHAASAPGGRPSGLPPIMAA